MEWLEVKHTRTQLAFAAASWLVLGSVLTSSGQNAPQPPSAGETSSTAGSLQEPTVLDSESLPPAVIVQRHGRLLVLTCGRSAGDGLSSNVSPRGEPPRFVIYQGQRRIASGQFEYG